MPLLVLEQQVPLQDTQAVVVVMTKWEPPLAVPPLEREQQRVQIPDTLALEQPLEALEENTTPLRLDLDMEAPVQLVQLVVVRLEALALAPDTLPQKLDMEGPRLLVEALPPTQQPWEDIPAAELQRPEPQLLQVQADTTNHMAEPLELLELQELEVLNMTRPMPEVQPEGLLRLQELLEQPGQLE